MWTGLSFLMPAPQVAADGIVISSRGLKISEAALTGEPDAILKEPRWDSPVYDEKTEKRGDDPWVRSGTSVSADKHAGMG